MVLAHALLDIQYSQWLVSIQCLYFPRPLLVAVCDSLKSLLSLFPRQADSRAEHLAATLTQGGQPADQLKDSFIQTNNELSPIGDPPGSSFPQKSRLESSALLRPKYICLSCSQSCVNSERSAHTQKTGHQFCMQAPRASANQLLINLSIRHGLQSPELVLSTL